MTILRRRWLLAALCVCGAAPLSAQDSAPGRVDSTTATAAPPAPEPKGLFGWWHKDHRFTLNDENDALGGSSDSAYTQGIRLRWDFSVWPTSPKFNKVFKATSLSWAIPGMSIGDVRKPCQADETRDQRPCGMTAISIVQTEYTPPVLTDPKPNYNTRPYAGFLYGTYGGTVLFPNHAITSELLVGVVGPASAARATQSLAHWTWSWASPEPLGWGNQLTNAPQIQLRDQYVGELFAICLDDVNGCDGSIKERRIFDIVPSAELLAGTLMNRASVGNVVHVGYRFPEFSSAFRIPIARGAPGPGSRLINELLDIRDQVVQEGWFMLYAGWDARYVATNGLLTGTYLFGLGNDEVWNANRRISLRHDVIETSWGFAFGIRRFSFNYMRTKRSSEFNPNGGDHTYGAFSVGIFTQAH